MFVAEVEIGMQTRDVASLLDVSETTVAKYADALEAVRGVAIARDGKQRKFSYQEVTLLCIARQLCATQPRLSIEAALVMAIEWQDEPMFAVQVNASLYLAVWLESRLENWKVEMAQISANQMVHFDQVATKYELISTLTEDLYQQGTQLQKTFDEFRGNQNPIRDEQKKLLNQLDATVESSKILFSFAAKCFLAIALANVVIFWLTTNQFLQAQKLIEKIPHSIVRTKK
jgi:hypothetical protein